MISKRFRERKELERVFSKFFNENVDDDIDEAKLLKDLYKEEGYSSNIIFKLLRTNPFCRNL